jgi:2'-5' RNA ligase
MYIDFALLVDHNIHNYARKLALEINEKYHTGLAASLLPQHISLKQSFEVNQIEEVEKYFDGLAQEIIPFEITFSKTDLITFTKGNSEIGILWMDTEENQQLRNLHNKINKDLMEQFGIMLLGPDGEKFHFHSTLIYGGQPVDIFKKIYRELDNKIINLKFIPKEMVMFYSPDKESVPSTYITYKILPIGSLNLK